MAVILRLNDFCFNNLQATAFTPVTRLLPARILSKLLAAVVNQFDASPTVLPLPDDAPSEIPRIILQSNDKQWQLEVAPARVNYRWIQMAEPHQLAPQPFCENFLHFLETFLTIESPRIGRMALVVTRYLLTERPAAVLSRHFCQEQWVQEALSNLENFELHSHSRTKIASSFEANSWIRFKSGQLTIPNTPVRPIVLVEQDVNTLAEEAELKDYLLDDVRKFLLEVQLEIESRFRSFLEV